MTPELQTERLKFRQWCEDDVAPMSEFYACEETARFVGGITTPDQVWRRVASYVGHWVLRGHGLWALEDRATGRFAGYAGLWSPPGFAERDLAWGLMPACRGRGLASEAARRVREFAFNDLGWQDLFSNIDEKNTPSIRLAERLGAVRERDILVQGQPGRLYRHPAPEGQK